MNKLTGKDEILRTFHQMACEKGLKQTNLDDLSKELKISKKTIYKYFHSKDDMVVEIVNGIMRDVLEISERSMAGSASPIHQYIDTISNVGSYLSKINPHFMADMQALYPELWDRLDRTRTERLFKFEKIIREGVRDGTFRKINSLAAVQMITASISAVLNPAFLSAQSLSTEEAVLAVKTILLDGIQEPKES